jgi:thiamine pyrophosphate-dependent acetolactate synthase large subunit-like protein
VKRYEAIETIVRSLEGDELIIGSNGMISRELFHIKDTPRNFYMIGSMGLASSIGLGLALNLLQRQIIVIEGDGNVLMNMGSMATIGHFAPRNFMQIVLDNESHDSTGGQPTVSNTISLTGTAQSAGYSRSYRADSAEDLYQAIRVSFKQGPVFILVKVTKGSDEGMSRVSHTPEQIKERFQKAAI